MEKNLFWFLVFFVLIMFAVGNLCGVIFHASNRNKKGALKCGLIVIASLLVVEILARII